MNIVIIRGNLKEGLDLAQRAASDRAELPILKNILIEAFENTIKLTATNLEIAVTAYVAGKVIEAGAVTVPITTLSSIIANLPTERVNLESQGLNLIITTDNYHGTIMGAPVSDFPLIPKIKNTQHFIELEGNIAQGALTQTLAAAQTSELRPELSSILLHFTLDTITLVATDTFRLAEKKVTKTHFTANEENSLQALIPLKTAQEIARAVRGKEPVKIFHDGNQIFFKSGAFELISRLLEGNFPDYSAIIPKEFSGEIIVHREECLSALKLISVVGNKNGEVRFKPAKNKKSFELISRSENLGENTYTLPARISGDIEEVTFNWRYLADGLRAIEGEEVVIGLHAEKPALLRGRNDGSFLYLLAPILGT